MASEILQLLQERALPVRQQLQLHRVRSQAQWDSQPHVDKQRGLPVKYERNGTAAAAANLHNMSCNHHGAAVCETDDCKLLKWNKKWQLKAPNQWSIRVSVHQSSTASICCTTGHAWSERLSLNRISPRLCLFFFIMPELVKPNFQLSVGHLHSTYLLYYGYKYTETIFQQDSDEKTALQACIYPSGLLF